MRLRACLLIFITCLLTTLAFAENSDVPQAGKDYEVLNSTGQSSTENNKVVVMQFFSWGCHACAFLEPTLEPWIKQLPKDVEFKRVPVAFSQAWLPLSKAYYAAKNLDVAEKISPLMFNATIKEQQNLSQAEDMAPLFEKVGISKEDFLNSYNFSPSIDAQINKASQLARQYQIMAIPTIIIAGKYKTDLSMTDGDADKLIATIDYLIDQARSGSAS